MTEPVNVIKPSYSAGELSPSIWGRTDFAKWNVGASVFRNCFVSYRGPASSRAGTMFAGKSLSPASASSVPPRLVRFQYNIFQSYLLEFGQDSLNRPYMRVVANGAMVLETPFNITGATRATPCVVRVPGHDFSNGDWIFIAGVTGMSQLNGRSYIVTQAVPDFVTLLDVFDIPVSSLGYGAYTGGGTAARIYTNYDVPFAIEDLPYLKVVQSADVMTLDCVNQVTRKEYPPVDLKRLAANNWEFDETTFAASIPAPTNVTASTSVTASPPTQYAYVVTAIDRTTGDESIASNVAYITTSDDISVTAGSHTITWNAVANAAYYNIYQAPPSYDTAVPVGSVFGYIGSAYGTQFVNDNIIPDQATTPPLHQNPFARGALLSVTVTNPGAGYSQATVSATVSSATGSGAKLAPVVVGGGIAAVIVENGGENYEPGDTIGFNGQTTGAGATATATSSATDGVIENVTVTAGGANYVAPNVSVSGGGTGADLVPIVVNGVITEILIRDGGTGYAAPVVTITDSAPAGSGATGTLNVGPSSGTYPSVPGYFQSRRAYAGTLNNPDTLYLSQTGSYTNMDASQPPVDSDAIVTTPWGQQVNGIQWLLPMPGGLIVATGLDAWQIAGASGAGSTLTPSSQSAQPQESNGFSPTVGPLKINYDILFNQSLGYVIRDIQYNFFNNIYAGGDISILSNHLFDGFEIKRWAWAQVPWKIVWATRDDGRFLSLTYDKEQQLEGWARHDTNGLVVDNEVATEPPVDAPYFIVKRYISGVRQWAYFIERMDNRLWQGPEDPWCVDAGLALVQPQPAATLSAESADSPGIVTGGYLANGGSGYTAPVAEVVDPYGLGSGASILLTQSGGIIDGITVVSGGTEYSPSSFVRIIDPSGGGATIVLFVSQNVIFNASAPVFGPADAGAVLRVGGGKAEVQSVVSAQQVIAAITSPILDVIPNDPNRLPVPAPAGTWSMTQPVTTVSNLGHLEGMTVAGLADGAEIPPTVVANGEITLPAPASAVTVGLPFIAQLQAMPIELPQLGTIQGRRKVMPGINVRMEKTRGAQFGANQPVASTLDFQEEVPWSNLVDVPEVPRAGVPAAALPLFTGDKYANLKDDWQNWNGWEASPGMVAAQQTKPFPMNILAFMPQIEVGDGP